MQKINFKKIIDRVINKAPGLVIGSVASNMLATQVAKYSNKLGTAAPMVIAGSQIVAGALVPAFLGKGKKEGFIEAVADGMMAQGAVQLAKALKIPGIGDTEESLSGAYEDYMNEQGATSATMAGSES